MSKYAFLRSNASLVIICLLLGLIGGFKIANSQYRVQQSAPLNRDIEKATSGMTGQQAEVAAIIEKAIANPNDVGAQIEAAIQFLQIERAQEALPFLEQARKTDPNDRRVIAVFGVAHFQLGQYDQAIDFLKRSREQGVNSPEFTSFLIGSYIQTRKNLDEAARLLKELETQGFDPDRLAQIRANLSAARSGGAATSDPTPSSQPKDGGEASKPRTVLSHGPEDPKPKSSRPRPQSGGVN
jgi:tetratricopeptide (TPR) repeat protein